MKSLGLVGRKLGHSFSKDYFTEKFNTLQIPDIQYLNFELQHISDLAEKVFQNPDVIGFNVTIPYKEEIIPYLDLLHESAKTIGAVNTVKKENGKWIGYNTDWIGFQSSLQEFLNDTISSAPDLSALVLGTGGAAKAVWYALEKMNIPFQKVSRIAHFDSDIISYEDVGLEDLVQYRLVVNTTPLGMHPNVEAKPAIPYSGFTKDHFAYDLIYNPAQTEFMLSAALYGAKTLNGYKMLVGQAEAAWQIWNN